MFWTKFMGIDEEPLLRPGNLSSTGLYIEMEHRIGIVGTLQWLQLTTSEKSMSLHVMVRVARMLDIEDLMRGRLQGVGLEFMPHDQETRQTLGRLIRTEIEEQLRCEMDVGVEHRCDVELDKKAGQREQATVHSLHVDRMLIDARSPLDVGEEIQFEIKPRAADTAVPFLGEVAKVTPRPAVKGQERYRIEVRIIPHQAQEEPDADHSALLKSSLDRLFDDLLAESPEPAAPLPRDHLFGSLDQVNMASLMALLEVESLTGELMLCQGEEVGRIQLKQGNIVDVEREGQSKVTPPQVILAELLAWQGGEFEFHAQGEAK